MNQDVEHLKLLGLFHYIVGGLIALFSCVPIIHLVIGIVLIVAPEQLQSQDGPPPAFMGWFFVILAAGFIFAGWTIAVLMILAGRFLRQQRRLRYCFVVACIACVFMPFGTVLGIFTLMALSKPEVKSLFVVPNVPPAFPT